MLSRAAVDVRDLCAVIVPHIYGNYYHAIRIRCFSTLRYMRIADLSRFSGMFSKLSIGDDAREDLRIRLDFDALRDKNSFAR